MSISDLSVKDYKERKDREKKGHLNKGSAYSTNLWVPFSICEYFSLFLSNRNCNNDKNIDNIQFFCNTYCMAGALSNT